MRRGRRSWLRCRLWSRRWRCGRLRYTDLASIERLAIVAHAVGTARTAARATRVAGAVETQIALFAALYESVAAFACRRSKLLCPVKARRRETAAELFERAVENVASMPVAVHPASDHCTRRAIASCNVFCRRRVHVALVAHAFKRRATVLTRVRKVVFRQHVFRVFACSQNQFRIGIKWRQTTRRALCGGIFVEQPIGAQKRVVNDIENHLP